MMINRKNLSAGRIFTPESVVLLVINEQLRKAEIPIQVEVAS
jgi:hypothetical protein